MALALAGALLRLGRPARAPDIGVANWSVEVADFQVGVARATPKVYKVTPLHRGPRFRPTGLELRTSHFSYPSVEPVSVRLDSYLSAIRL